MVLVEGFGKLGHQGVNRTYHLIKQQYDWKGMNKDICKYINSFALCKREKARAQAYPLQMADIPNRPFDKIAIDLISDLNVSALGNQHILTSNDHLMGWSDVFPSATKRKDTIVHVFINNYLCINMCPHFILSNNETEFKNQLMDNVLQNLGIDDIFSDPYHPQSNGKLEVFHLYLKPTLRKL